MAAGKRPPKPANCQPLLFLLMQACWVYEYRKQDDVRKQFDALDKNKDGKLELDEVHHNVDFFAVGKILKHREALHSEL